MRRRKPLAPRPTVETRLGKANLGVSLDSKRLFLVVLAVVLFFVVGIVMLMKKRPDVVEDIKNPAAVVAPVVQPVPVVTPAEPVKPKAP